MPLTAPTVRCCARCGRPYPLHLMEAAFRLVGNRVRDASRTHRLGICRPCEQTARDQRKRGDRWQAKARDVIRRHAVRLEVSKSDLVSVYGWDQARLAHDAEYQYGNGCNYCGHQYREMGHGLADITLDIVDRSKPPYYRTNAKWCCQTCNRKKGDRGPEFFERDRQVYELWTQWQQLTADQRGMLF